jgi:DNA ligase (NAD+)
MDKDPGVDESGKPNKHNTAMSRLIAIEGVGETVARLLLEGLDTRSEVVENLSRELDITEESRKQETGPLGGQTFCITGTLARPRKEIALMIKAAGGKVVSTVSGKLDHLVAGNSAGSKLDKANRLAVNVLSEADLEAMLAGEISEEEANIAETAGEIVADAGPQQMSLGDYSSSEPLE